MARHTQRLTGIHLNKKAVLYGLQPYNVSLELVCHFLMGPCCQGQHCCPCSCIVVDPVTVIQHWLTALRVTLFGLNIIFIHTKPGCDLEGIRKVILSPNSIIVQDYYVPWEQSRRVMRLQPLWKLENLAVITAAESEDKLLKGADLISSSFL